MLIRLIYASEPAASLSPATLQHIVSSARVHNQRLHVSGMLVFDSGSFLQVLEGDRATIGALYHRIAADPRHRRLELLEVVPIHERRFGRWSMGFAAADAANAELFMRFGGSPRFEPHTMSADSALGLLQALGRLSSATHPVATAPRDLPAAASLAGVDPAHDGAAPAGAAPVDGRVTQPS